MDEEDWRIFQLWGAAGELSTARVKSLEAQLRRDPSNMDARVQLFSYYYKKKHKHKDAAQKLFEQVLWLIEHKPALTGILAHRLALTGCYFKPKHFAALRHAWLEQIHAAPSEGTILGNAASFIAWNDIATASILAEQAYVLQPTAGWLGTLVIHCDAALESFPALYRDSIREYVISVGIRSLETELGGAQFFTCECVSDAAIDLGNFEVVRWCADILSNYKDPASKQRAKAYLGLVALREGDSERAVQLLREVNYPLPAVFRLATELFHAGYKTSVINLIYNFKRRINKSARTRWLEQVANDQPPDFCDHCC
jgi:hypothetical protein